MADTRYLREHSLRDGRDAALLHWLLDHGADEFSLSVMALQQMPARFADAFEDACGSYEITPVMRRHLTSSGHSESVRATRLWTLSPESLARLLDFFPNGIFHSHPRPEGWFEDLAVYREGELIFGLVSHEGEGVLRLSTAEHAEVAGLGIESYESSASIGY